MPTGRLFDACRQAASRPLALCAAVGLRLRGWKYVLHLHAFHGRRGHFIIQNRPSGIPGRPVLHGNAARFARPFCPCCQVAVCQWVGRLPTMASQQRNHFTQISIVLARRHCCCLFRHSVLITSAMVAACCNPLPMRMTYPPSATSTSGVAPHGSAGSMPLRRRALHSMS